MRYTNWDVLIFPEGSKIPLQEFKTACHILKDRETFSSELGGNLYQINVVANDQTVHRQTPTVTCFVADLQTGSSFRISLHSWEPPTASQKGSQVAQMYEGRLYWEARVLIDGVCVAGMLFNDTGPWPQIIDTSSLINKDGEHDDLRWPSFRTEMMTQNWWSAGEDVGRIKVIITEGFLPGDINRPFMRLKNLVTFAFQHAPLNILENSQIAYPSPGMWYQSAQPYYNPPSPTRPELEDADLHAHSPRRKARQAQLTDKTQVSEPPARFLELMPPPPLPRRDHSVMDPGLRSQGPVPDPFIDHFTGPRFVQIRNSSESSSDQLMPDYSRSITPASSVGHRDPRYNVFYEELIQKFDQRRDLNSGNSGVAPPVNTRVSSAENTPLTREAKPITAGIRAASGAHKRKPGLEAKSVDDHAPTSENHLGVPDEQNFAKMGEGVALRVSPKPMSEVKGKKATRKASIVSIKEEDKENIDAKTKLSDGKRKRSSTVLGPATAKLPMSPSRKASKVDIKESVEIEVLTPGLVEQTGGLQPSLEELLGLPEVI